MCIIFLHVSNLSLKVSISDRVVSQNGFKKYFATFLLFLTFSAQVPSLWVAYAAPEAPLFFCSRPYSLCYFFSYPRDIRDLPEETRFFRQTNHTDKQMSRAARDIAKLNAALLFFHAANLRQLIITMCESKIYSAFGVFFSACHVTSLFERQIFLNYHVPSKLLNYFNYLLR